MLSRFGDVDFVFASELKAMNGDSSIRVSIPNTKVVFNLRDHQSGKFNILFLTFFLLNCQCRPFQLWMAQSV